MNIPSAFLDRYSSTDVGGEGPDPDVWTDLLEEIIGDEPGIDPDLYRSLAEHMSWARLEMMVRAGVRLVLAKPIGAERPCEVCGVVGKVVEQTFYANCDCVPW